MEQTDKDDFEKALDLCDEGRFVEALVELSTIGERESCALHARIMSGHILLYDLEDLKEAERHLREALKIKPGAKRASFFLYSALLEQGRIEEAIEEGERYFTQRKLPISPDDELTRDYKRELITLMSVDPDVIEEIRNEFLTNGVGSSPESQGKYPDGVPPRGLDS